MTLEAANAPSREQALMLAENLAVRLFSGAAGAIQSAFPRRFSFSVDSAKNQNPASRVNHIFLFIMTGSGHNEKTLKIKINLDHTLDNPREYSRGLMFMSSYYVLQNGATPHGGMYGWFAMNSTTLAQAIVANHTNFFR